jgi:hypothetical protein
MFTSELPLFYILLKYSVVHVLFGVTVLFLCCFPCITVIEGWNRIFINKKEIIIRKIVQYFLILDKILINLAIERLSSQNERGEECGI